MHRFISHSVRNVRQLHFLIFFFISFEVYVRKKYWIMLDVMSVINFPFDDISPSDRPNNHKNSIIVINNEYSFAILSLLEKNKGFTHKKHYFFSIFLLYFSLQFEYYLVHGMCMTYQEKKDNHIIMCSRGKTLEKCSFNLIMSKLILNNAQTYFALFIWCFQMWYSLRNSRRKLFKGKQQ